jgi:hypothetical protein
VKDINVSVITGTEKERIEAIRSPAYIYTTNYEQLVWLVAYWGDKWPYKTVVLDESTKVKSFRLRQGGKRAQALGSIAHTRITRLIELTGTPASNGLKDLWGQAWFVDAGTRLGRTFTAFDQRWFRTGFDGFSKIPLPGAQNEIQDKLRDVCLTIDAADWFDLHEPIVNNIFVDLPPKARKHYKEMEDAMYTELEGIELEAFNAAAKTVKCLQLAAGAAYTDDTGKWKETHKVKLEALESIIEEAAGMPVVRGRKVMSLERQVRIAAGSLVASGAALAAFGPSPLWQQIGMGLAGFIGSGLVFAGVTDTCGMGMLIAKMPWNQAPKSAAGQGSSYCRTN